MRSSLALVLVLAPGILAVPGAPALAAQSPGDLAGSPATSTSVPSAPETPLRPWHESVTLRAELERSGSTPERVLALARAEAGWGNWPAVVELLEEADWLGGSAGREGRRLLALALDDAGRWEEAAAALGEVVVSDGGGPALTIRRIRALSRAGRGGAALESFRTTIQSERSAFLSSWVALDLATTLAEAGDTAGTREARDALSDEEALDRGRLLLADAYLEVGDSLRAMESLREVIPTVRHDRRRSRGWVTLAELRLASDNPVGARDAFVAAIGAADRGAPATRSAEALMELEAYDAVELPRLARILARGGRTNLAVEAYGLHLASGGSLSEESRLVRARLLSATNRLTEAAEEFAALGESEDPAVGGPALDALARVQRRQGRTGAARATQDRLVARFPQRPEALDVVFFRADSQQDAGLVEEAIAGYGRVASMSPSLSRAGQSRMRQGQLRLTQGNVRAAAEVFESYLTDFPQGRRWQEASFWAAWSLLQLGEATPAAAHIDRVRSEDPFSYYAFMGAELAGESHLPELEPDPAAPASPLWMAAGLAELDILRDAGLDDAVDAAVDRLSARARARTGDLLSLAEALVEREMPIRAINLGWEARGEGHPWSRRLARIIYPLPYRELILAEAAEREVDPFLMAALIRQESAFEPAIVSSAGAVGLMQVMPPTGRELARSVGPRDFRDSSLTIAEVNLHLGSRFLADMLRRYDDRLTLVLSAYNAGPSRANRWRQLPEAADPARFTERIPFAETRGYVKNVTRNFHVYRWLYGGSG